MNITVQKRETWILSRWMKQLIHWSGFCCLAVIGVVSFSSCLLLQIYLNCWENFSAIFRWLKECQGEIYTLFSKIVHTPIGIFDKTENNMFLLLIDWGVLDAKEAVSPYHKSASLAKDFLRCLYREWETWTFVDTSSRIYGWWHRVFQRSLHGIPGHSHHILSDIVDKEEIAFEIHLC